MFLYKCFFADVTVVVVVVVVVVVMAEDNAFTNVLKLWSILRLNHKYIMAPPLVQRSF